MARHFWKFRSCKHAISPRRILGSISFSAEYDSGNNIRVLYLRLDCSSQKVICKNVTSKCTIMHLGSDALVFHLPDGTRHAMCHFHDDMQSYIPFQAFCDSSICNGLTESIIYLYAISSKKNSYRRWKEIIDCRRSRSKIADR